MFKIIKNFFVTTWQRMKSETPIYFRRISLMAALLAALSGFLSENETIIPEDYKYIVKYITAMSAAVALVVRLTTTDSVLSQKGDNLLLKKNKDETIDTVS